MARAEKSGDEQSLPKGWRWVRFGDVVRHVKDSVDPKHANIERYVAGEHMDTDDLRLRRWGSVGDGYLGPAFHRRFVEGQVLYGSRRTYLRKVTVAPFDGVCANTTFVMEPATEDLLSELLPFIMQTDAFNEHSVKQSKGSVNPYVNWKDLAWYEFALPPKHEQRRIAEILHAAAKLTQQRRILGKTIRDTLQALVDDVFGRTKQAVAVRGKKLDSVCSLQNGRIFPSTDYQDAGVRLLRPGNLGKNGSVIWPSSATVYLPARYKEEAGDFLVDSGEVLINLTAQSLEEGFIGRVCLTQGQDAGSLLNQRIGRFHCDDELMPEFLFRFCQSWGFRNAVETRCEGSKIRHLYWRHISDLEILLPSLNEQKRAVDSFKRLDEAAVRCEELAQSEQKLMGDLRERLLCRERDGRGSV